MTDVKISDLTAATSAKRAMQLEVNDAGTSKRIDVGFLSNLDLEQIGTTQNCSGQTTVTFSSIPANYNELWIDHNGITANTNGSATFYTLIAEYSFDGGSTYYGLGGTTNEDYNIHIIRDGTYPSAPSFARCVSKFQRLFPDAYQVQINGITTWDSNDETGSGRYLHSSGTYNVAAASKITNLRVKSFWVQAGVGITLNTMTAGTVKLSGR